MGSISIVIPTLDEEENLSHLLADLRHVDANLEIVVVDGGSGDLTEEIAREAGARVLRESGGRGAQLRRGAIEATNAILCFLHADVRLGRGAAATLGQVARRPEGGARAFRLRISDHGLVYRLIEAGANRRTAWFGLSYGDQGLIVGRDQYARAGGYPPWPIMEDVALVRALGREHRVRLLDAHLEVSPRRWRRDGPLRRSVANQILLLRFLAGASPDALAELYRPEGSADA
jgi:rSAM/selenodomain-associated transferase 2